MAGSGNFNRRRKEVLTDLYRQDGDGLLERDKYRAALQLYNMALRCDPADVKSLINRSKCHLKLNQIRKATDDIDTALHLDNLDKEALLQKAEVLFKTQNYEMALVYYNRGLKHYPKSVAFQEGVKKTDHFITKGNRKKAKRMKLTHAGDLTYLVHKSPSGKPFVFENKTKSLTKHLPKPSASFRDRPLCQLIRIHKTPAVVLPRVMSLPNLSHTPSTSVATLNEEDKRPESKMVKTTLKELYKDKKYLEKLSSNTVFPAVGGMGSPIQDKAEDAVNFLYDRYHYWNRLGPLPPPPPLQKSRASRYSGSSMSVDSLGTARTTESKTTWKSGESGMSWKTKTIKSRLGITKPDKGTKPKPDPASLEFKFESHNPSMDLGTRRMTEIAEENEDSTDSKQTEEETKSNSQAVTDYLKKQLDIIQTLFAQRRFADTVKKCEAGLELLAKYSDANVPEKFEMTGLLNSYLGNVAVNAGDFTRALKHHTVDLKIGEKCDIQVSRHRALGNLGRTHMLQGKYNRALEMYTMKAPLCKTAAESSALFHDIGNCFLMLNNFSYARDAGRKSLETGQEADDRRLQLQACVLIGLSEVNMKKFKDAYNSFDAGLTHAQALGDKQAEDAMNHALIDVNKKLANKSKKNQSESRDIYPPSSHASDSARSVMVES
ncbi:uncharacterized protein LOC117322500 isoform X1 [Pecten maximus]|uniref:uncharacterized protein LOC117322500 isoform X1 n=2 Tax=Pecten maximus TaxID=6579 RepID=UPI001458BB3B|nr:uncharacterized protein LOC117322500 isoform X1 [Pecten maximus]